MTNTNTFTNTITGFIVMRKLKAYKKRILMGVTVAALVAVTAAGALIANTMNTPNPNDPAPTPAISAKADTKALSDGKTIVTDQKGDIDNKLDPYYRLDSVNGESVYTDIKNVAPKNNGNSYRFFVPGKTTDGFRWHGSVDNDNVMIRCDFNKTKNQYNFEFCGLKPGTSHVELKYDIANGVESAADFNLTIDKNLNVFVV